MNYRVEKQIAVFTMKKLLIHPLSSVYKSVVNKAKIAVLVQY